MKRGSTCGHYDPALNILHIWYEKPIVMNDELSIVRVFDEVESEWVRPCPAKPYLLVNYANISILPGLTDA